MSDKANNLLPKRERLGRFVATVGDWLQAFDYTSFDDTQDRIDRLERKVVELGGRVGSDPRVQPSCI